MFAIPGFVTLAFFVYVRPQELIGPLANIPTLNLLIVLALLGLAVDLRLGITKLRPSPLFWWAVAYFGWGLFTLAVRAPGMLSRLIIAYLLSISLFLLGSQAIQSFRSLRAVANVVLLATVFVAGVGIMQNYGPHGCVRQLGTARFEADGRSCETELECFEGSDQGGWECEKIGPLGTMSVAGRVRYRGVLEDPNELAMVLAIGLPFAFARRAWSPGPSKTAFVAAALVAFGACVVFTQSRSGQLSFLVVIGVYLLRRLGSAGVVMAAIAAAPMLLLGGRSGAEADSSNETRYAAWATGIKLWWSSPLIGVGMGQFTEYHYLTAHNSYVLTLTEMGTPGILILIGTCWFAFRWLLAVARASKTPERRVAQIWSIAMIAALCGMMISAFFLSLSHHPVFWLYMGLASGCAEAARRHDPKLEVRARLMDFVGIAAVALFIGVALRLLLRYKNAY